MGIHLKITLALIGVGLVLFFVYFNLPIKDKKVDSPRTPSFSSVTSRTPAVAHYPSGSAIIHSINNYPTLLRLFDPAEIRRWLTPDLIEMQAGIASKKYLEASEFSISYVYQTSYYIGNLLIAPDKHLVQVLDGKPVSAHLFEYALADLRAVTTQLQDFYDVAPPYFYDTSIVSSLVYEHPSFPSLLGAEAYLVYLIIAQLDPKNARQYAQLASQYISTLRSTGSHYDFDIDYSLQLSSLLLPIMLDQTDYQGLFDAAGQEWLNQPLIAFEEKINIEFLPGFTLPRRLMVRGTGSGSSNNLSGNMIMSLVDQRIPDANSRLYELDLDREQIIPIALDLNARNYLDLMPSLGDYSNSVSGGYHFSGSPFKLRNRFDVYPRNPIQAWTRSGFEEPPRLLFVLDQVDSYKKLSANSNGTYWIAWSAKTNNLSVVEASTNRVSDLGKVKAVSWFDQTSLIFVSDYGLELYSTLSGDRKLITPIGFTNDSDEYFVATETNGAYVIIISQNYDVANLQHEAALALYKVNEQELELLRVMTISDAYVESAVLSPDGQFVGLLVSDGITNWNGSILLLDTNSGIIKKEIRLNDFSPANRSLEAWLF
jgi:hypothetical protein